MNKMLAMRKAIIQKLSIFDFRVFYQQANENAQYPYITFDINNSTDDGTLERFTMDVDGWGNDLDTYSLEELMHNIDYLLHREQFQLIDETLPDNPVVLVFTIYRENRLTFDESDKRIYHRRYIYQIRTYEMRN